MAVAGLGLAASWRSGPALVEELAQRAQASRDAAGGEGIAMDFTLANGWLTRHPVLSGGEGLPDEVRARAAAAIAAGRTDLVSFGRLYIANPDLAERIRVGAEWAPNVNVPKSWYLPGPAGYTDYPTLSGAAA